METLLDEVLRTFGPEGETRRIVLLGSILLGATSGALGSFAYLRRQSLLGDAMAHAALPGVCLAFLFTGERNLAALLVGATATGALGALVILAVTRTTRIKEDAAIGLVLSVFFGIGIVLLSRIQHTAAGNQAGLSTFLFGRAASLLASDVALIGGAAAALLALVAAFFKELQVATFDRAYAASLGLPVRRLDLLLSALLTAAVMIGLQAVGVVLMAALLILPAAAARQWTDRLGRMVGLAAAIGATSGALGAFLSALAPRLPTGPVMVTAAAFVLGVSVIAAPRRGLLAHAIRQMRFRRRIEEENLLKELHHREETAPGVCARLPDLAAGQRLPGTRVERVLERLVRAGRVARTYDDAFLLTEAGGAAARAVVRKHRLWEAFLTMRLDLPPDHVHRDAEEMEHVLTPEVTAEIERVLADPARDPHGRPIPRS